MENKTYFRSAVVGGYNKNDVHRCIQELKKVTEEELLTSEEIISELNVQLEEQKNEFETMLEEQKVDSEERIEEERNRYDELKGRYDDMLADVKEEYEEKIIRLEEELELQKSQVKEVVQPIVVEEPIVTYQEPVVESREPQHLAMIEALQQELDTWKAQCENWNEKYDALYTENKRLVAKYDSLLAENDELKKDYRIFLEKKDIVFKYEMDSRARADQIVADSELEAKKRLQEAEAKIILMIQESKGRIDSSMTKYVSLCDGYREQTHVSAFAAMKLQKQMEELIVQLSDSNRMIKQKVSALYSQTDKGIDMFRMDVEEEFGFLDGE